MQLQFSTLTDFAWCSRCQALRPREEFFQDKHRAPGCSSRCRPCAAAARRERYANDAAWRAKERARGIAQYVADPQKHNRRRAKWARENRDKANAAERRLNARHPEDRRAKWTDDRGRRRTGRVGPSVLEHVARLRLERCVYCGGPGGEVDHIMPVARGGTHTVENLTSACRSCNSSKGARTVAEFMVYKMGLAR